MEQPRPLSDDWFSWDPEEIDRYPAGVPGTVAGPREDARDRASLGRRARREILWHAGAGFGVGLAAAALLGVIVLLLPRGAAAAGDPAPMAVEEVTRGTLLFRTGTAGRYLPAPAVGTDVEVSVTGLVARTRVRQRFENPGSRWIEGVYVFPLPESGAVDHMRMEIGERIAEGVIEERSAARKIYRDAAAAGKKAALVEQERPNIFTNSVANIGPGESVMVEIEFQQTLGYEGGRFGYRFPMVVGPRFVPGGAPATEGPPLEESIGAVDGMGWARNTARVPDASRITPPVLHPDEGAVNPVSITVHLDAGLPLARVESRYHEVRIESDGPGRRVMTLADAEVPADRDFVLDWHPAPGEAPRAALFENVGPEGAHVLLMLMPPEAGTAPRLAREVVFVVDTSGSMAGTSMAQAREALLIAVERLEPADRFNVIQFNSGLDSLYPDARPATAMARAAAVHYIRSLHGGGGTNMAPALERALAAGGSGDRVRQVVFLTDGAVGNERELFALVERHLGESRLFTVGIGSAPNGYFMTRAARAGRGTYTYIGKVSEVAAEMKTLFARLESPVMREVEVEWPATAGSVEAWPRRVPDLYRGEPVVVAARLERIAGEIVVRGRRDGRGWRATMPLAGGQSNPGIGVNWARRKIAALMDSTRSGTPLEQVRPAVVEVALRHHLVSRFTSLVAVDRAPSRPAGADLDTNAVPTNLPAGWQYEKVFGHLPRTATPAALHLGLGLAALVLAGAGLAGSRRLA